AVRLARVALAQPAGEQAAVVVHPRRLPVAQRGHLVGEPEPFHRQLRVVGVEVEHRLARAHHERRGGLRRVRGGEHLVDPRQRDLVVGRDRVLLAREVAEERPPPDARRGRDVVDRRLLVAARAEQPHGRRHERAPHLRSSLGRAATTDIHGTESNRDRCTTALSAVKLAGMNPDFDTYRLSEEHEALREAVRALAEKEIAPYAAEVDEQGRFPTEAHNALVKAGFQAVIIPEEFGGQGADELAGCIVIEEVARVCASSSLIPAVNGLGLTPILLSASDELKREVLPSIAAGDAMISYALSEREAGSDAASMKTRARRDGDSWVLNGTKCWITN